MNILITGGTGFIGSHLVKSLLILNHRLFVFVRPYSDLSRIEDVAYKIHFISTTDSYRQIKYMIIENAIDGIIHLATYYRKEDKDAEKKEMINTNVIFPSLIISLIKEPPIKSIKFFINTGTCFEYKQSIQPIEENSLIEPFNYYASTKLLFEEKLKNEIIGTNIKAITLKLFFPYGENDNNKFIKLLIESLIKKNTIHITEGEQLLGFTYVQDIINAYLLSIEYIERMKTDYEVFNIGGIPVTLKKIVQILEKKSITKNLIIRDKEYSSNEIMSMYANTKKAYTYLGWKQLYAIEKGLGLVYNYYLNNLHI